MIFFSSLGTLDNLDVNCYSNRMKKLIELTGNAFGDLTVVNLVQAGRDIPTIWRCRCKCGELVDVHSSSLRQGRRWSCGRATSCLVGEVKGKMTFLRVVGKRAGRGKVRCECGREKEVEIKPWKRGAHLSCGFPGCRVVHGSIVKDPSYITTDSTSAYINFSTGLVAVADLSDAKRLKESNWRVHRGYVYETTGEHHSLHRILMGVERDRYPMIDHIDGNKLNNHRCNLRFCTPAQNMQNMRTPRSNSTGFKGVSPVGSQFMAYVYENNKQIYLGRFDTREDAAQAYNEAATEHFGEFARLNPLGDLTDHDRDLILEMMGE